MLLSELCQTVKSLYAVVILPLTNTRHPPACGLVASFVLSPTLYESAAVNDRPPALPPSRASCLALCALHPQPGMHPGATAAACAAIMVAGLAALMFLPDKVPDAAGRADQPTDHPARTTVSPMTTMVRWVKAHGVKAKPVKISSGDRGRGIFMSKPAKAGATLYEVPETTWMSGLQQLRHEF